MRLDGEAVQCYLYALLDEAKRRGEMFPQTSDEQDADSKAVHRVCGMVRWYAERGEPTPKAIEKLALRRAENMGCSMRKEHDGMADRLWASEEVMSINAELGLTMDQLIRLASAILKA